MGVLGSYFAGWSLVGLCLWFRYPVRGVSVDSYFHILMTMHGQNHFKLVYKLTVR